MKSLSFSLFKELVSSVSNDSSLVKSFTFSETTNYYCATLLIDISEEVCFEFYCYLFKLISFDSGFSFKTLVDVDDFVVVVYYKKENE